MINRSAAFDVFIDVEPASGSAQFAKHFDWMDNEAEAH